MNRLDNADSFSLALLLAKKLILDLDAKDYSSVDAIATIMDGMPVELVNAFLRIITLDKIVNHSLDEHGAFAKFLKKYDEECRRLTKEIREEDESVSKP